MMNAAFSALISSAPLTEEQCEIIVRDFNEVTEMGVSLGALLCLSNSFLHLQRFLLSPDGTLNSARVALFSNTFFESVQAANYGEEIEDIVTHEPITWQEGVVYCASNEAGDKFYGLLNAQSMFGHIHYKLATGLPLTAPHLNTTHLIQWVIRFCDLPLLYLKELFEHGALKNLHDSAAKERMALWGLKTKSYHIEPRLFSLSDPYPLAHILESPEGRTLFQKLKMHDASFMPHVAMNDVFLPEFFSRETSAKILTYLDSLPATFAPVRHALTAKMNSSGELPSRLFFEVLDCEQEITNLPLLYWLAQEPGLILLQEILTAYGILYKHVTPDALYARRPMSAEADANTSALYYLAESQEGCTLLARLFARIPTLMDAPQLAEALYALRPESAGALANTSALYCVAESQEGRALLAQLFANNGVALIDAPQAIVALCALRSRAAGIKANTSALYYLAAFPQRLNNRNTLLKWLLFRDNVIAQLKAETLYALRPALAGADENTSVIYHLSVKPDLYDAITRLFDERPALIDLPQATEALYARRPETAGAFANTSALYWFTALPAGQQILVNLFLRKPNFMNTLQAAATFYALRPEAAGADANTSAFYWLTAGKKDCALLLLELFHQNPELMPRQLLPQAAAALYTLRPAAAIADTNRSAFLWLAATEEGQNLLGQLFNSRPTLMDASGAAEALYALSTDAAGAGKNLSVLYYLTIEPQGRALLARLFARRPDMMDVLPATTLYAILSEAAEEHENTSAFYWLAACRDGAELLARLFARRPELMDAPQAAEALYALTSAAAGKYANTSALYYLTASQEGLALLRQLFDRAPRLMREMPTNVLCMRSVITNASPLFLLSKTEEGQTILLNLLNNNRALRSSINMEHLTQSYSITTLLFFSTTQTVLQNLQASHSGRAVLAVLQEHLPELARIPSPVQEETGCIIM